MESYPTKSSPPLRRWCIAICVLVATALVVWWGRRSPEPIPNPDLSQAYPEVADVIRESRELVAAHPDSDEAWGDYGLVLAAHEHTEEALACFREAVRWDSSDLRWPYFLGHLLQSRQPREAAGWFERVAQGSLESRAAFAWSRAAETHLLAEDSEAAQAAVRKARAADSTHPQSAFVEARVAFAHHDSQAALVAIERANQLQPNHRDVLELYAQVLRQVGETARAGETSAAASRLAQRDRSWPDPWLAELHSRRVDPYWRLHQARQAHAAGDLIQARRLLEPLVERHADEPQFGLWLARVEYDSGRIDAALEVLNPALTRHSLNADLLALRGSCWLLRENWSRAIADLRSATQQSPQRPSFWVDLAFALRQQRQFPESEAACEAALRIDAELTFAWIELAHLRLDQGRAPDAARIVDEHLSQRPEDSALQRLRDRIRQETTTPGD